MCVFTLNPVLPCRKLTTHTPDGKSLVSLKQISWILIINNIKGAQFWNLQPADDEHRDVVGSIHQLLAHLVMKNRSCGWKLWKQVANLERAIGRLLVQTRQEFWGDLEPGILVRISNIYIFHH